MGALKGIHKTEAQFALRGTLGTPHPEVLSPEFMTFSGASHRVRHILHDSPQPVVEVSVVPIDGNNLHGKFSRQLSFGKLDKADLPVVSLSDLIDADKEPQGEQWDNDAEAWNEDGEEWYEEGGEWYEEDGEWYEEDGEWYEEGYGEGEEPGHKPDQQNGDFNGAVASSKGPKPAVVPALRTQPEATVPGLDSESDLSDFFDPDTLAVMEELLTPRERDSSDGDANGAKKNAVLGRIAESEAPTDSDTNSGVDTTPLDPELEEHFGFAGLDDLLGEVSASFDIIPVQETDRKSRVRERFGEVPLTKSSSSKKVRAERKQQAAASEAGNSEAARRREVTDMEQGQAKRPNADAVIPADSQNSGRAELPATTGSAVVAAKTGQTSVAQEASIDSLLADLGGKFGVGATSAGPAPKQAAVSSTAQTSSPSIDNLLADLGGKFGADSSSEPTSGTRSDNVVSAKEQMELRENRLATYAAAGNEQGADFPCKNPSAETCADAGLFFSPTQGRPDQCRCASCGVRLFAWEAGDDPMREHAESKPKCPVVKRLKTEQPSTVADSPSLGGEKEEVQDVEKHVGADMREGTAPSSKDEVETLPSGSRTETSVGSTSGVNVGHIPGVGVERLPLVLGTSEGFVNDEGSRKSDADPAVIAYPGFDEMILTETPFDRVFFSDLFAGSKHNNVIGVDAANEPWVISVKRLRDEERVKSMAFFDFDPADIAGAGSPDGKEMISKLELASPGLSKKDVKSKDACLVCVRSKHGEGRDVVELKKNLFSQKRVQELVEALPPTLFHPDRIPGKPLAPGKSSARPVFSALKWLATSKRDDEICRRLENVRAF
jgi:Inhibitor of Apoptosis domain